MILRMPALCLLPRDVGAAALLGNGEVAGTPQ